MVQSCCKWRCGANKGGLLACGNPWHEAVTNGGVVQTKELYCGKMFLGVATNGGVVY